SSRSRSGTCARPGRDHLPARSMMNSRVTMRLLVGVAAVCASAGAAVAQEPAPDLHTLELIGTPDLRRFGGEAVLLPPESPFTAPVTAAGVHRWSLRLHLDSLPDPRSLGPYTAYVAWAAPPALRPMQRLGVVPWAG